MNNTTTSNEKLIYHMAKVIGGEQNLAIWQSSIRSPKFIPTFFAQCNNLHSCTTVTGDNPVRSSCKNAQQACSLQRIYQSVHSVLECRHYIYIYIYIYVYFPHLGAGSPLLLVSLTQCFTLPFTAFKSASVCDVALQLQFPGRTLVVIVRYLKMVQGLQYCHPQASSTQTCKPRLSSSYLSNCSQITRVLSPQAFLLLGSPWALSLVPLFSLPSSMTFPLFFLPNSLFSLLMIQPTLQSVVTFAVFSLHFIPVSTWQTCGFKEQFEIEH